MSNVGSRVREVIKHHLNVTDEQVQSDEASFTGDLGADSLDSVEMVMGFEEEFGITIPDEDAEKITTVGEAVAYVEKASE